MGTISSTVPPSILRSVPVTHDAAGHSGLDRAGKNGVDPDALPEVGGHRTGQLCFGRLTGVVSEMGTHGLADVFLLR